MDSFKNCLVDLVALESSRRPFRSLTAQIENRQCWQTSYGNHWETQCCVSNILMLNISCDCYTEVAQNGIQFQVNECQSYDLRLSLFDYFKNSEYECELVDHYFDIPFGYDAAFHDKLFVSHHQQKVNWWKPLLMIYILFPRRYECLVPCYLIH